MLSAELGNESSPPHVRNAAGLAMKNALTAKVRASYPPNLTSEIAPHLFSSGKRPKRRVQQSLVGRAPGHTIKDQTRFSPCSRIVLETSRYSRCPVGGRNCHRGTPKWPVARTRGTPAQLYGSIQRQPSRRYPTSYWIHLRINRLSIPAL